MEPAPWYKNSAYSVPIKNIDGDHVMLNLHLGKSRTYSFIQIVRENVKHGPFII